MLVLKYLMFASAAAAFVAAAAILLFDVYLLAEYRRRLTLATDQPLPIPRPIRTKVVVQSAAMGLLFILFASSIAIVPSGMAGVRVSRLSGTVPGTLYPGVHFVMPLVESVALYDVRDQFYTTSAGVSRKASEKPADDQRSRVVRQPDPIDEPNAAQPQTTRGLHPKQR